MRARTRVGAASSRGAAGAVSLRPASGEPRRPGRVAACDGADGAPLACDFVEGAQVAGIQRSRLLAGAVGAIEEFGYARTTVAQITSRARVSRRTFYELFDNREACFAALLEDVVGVVEGELVAARLDGLPWRQRVRGGLSVILSFLDREPALARVCVVQALRGGPEVLERREEIFARLARAIDEGRGESARSGECTELTAEGLVGAAFTIVHARLSREERRPGAQCEPLSGLLGELASLIVLPYLGAAAARREHSHPTSAPTALTPVAGTQQLMASDPLQGIPMRLTYRTARVLRCIAQQPAISNRAVADQAGISDQGQISKLLSRLERLGLVANTGVGHAKGEANKWKLTPLGEQVAQRLSMSNGQQHEAV